MGAVVTIAVIISFTARLVRLGSHLAGAGHTQVAVQRFCQQLDKAGKFHSPEGVAIDRRGDVYVADTLNNRIQKFSQTGKLLAIYATDYTSPEHRFGAFGSIGGPWGIAIDHSGNIYASNVGYQTVVQLSPTGKPLAQWGTSLSAGKGRKHFDNPVGVALDRHGNLYVADSLNNRIVKLGPGGKVVSMWGTAGTGPGQFDRPVGLAIDAHGDLYVADSHNDRVEKFTAAGALLATWGTHGTGPGEFDLTQGVAVDRRGDVYVSDVGNSRIEKLSPGGRVLRVWSTPDIAASGDCPAEMTSPRLLSVDAAGDVYVADAGSDLVEKFSPGGRLLETWGKVAMSLPGYPPQAPTPVPTPVGGAFVSPVGPLAFDRAGHIYVLDSTEHQVSTIRKLTLNDHLLAVWGLGGGLRFKGTLTQIAADAKDAVYVVEKETSTIHKLSSTGRQLAVWGGTGSAPGQFSTPAHIATDVRGNLYVADSGNNRVETFSPSGKVLAIWGGSSGGLRVKGPWGIAVGPRGDVYVTDWQGRIQRLSPSGRRLAMWTLPSVSTGPGFYNVAVDRKGTVYVCDEIGVGSLFRYTSAGKPLPPWGDKTILGGYGCQYVAVDPRDNVYVASLDTIQKFDPTGKRLAAWTH